MMKIVTYVDGDDWVGLYLDGKLIEEGHSLPLSWALGYVSQLGEAFSFETITPNQEWLDDNGRLPDQLSEVVHD